MPSTDRFNKGGYMLYPRGTGGSSYYIFNQVIGNMQDVTYKDNYNRTELKTFGKFPSIFYVGETKYKTFTLQTVFTTDDTNNLNDADATDSIGGRPVGENDSAPVFTAYDKYREFKKIVDSRIPWCVRGSVNGEDFICDIEITQTVHNQNTIIQKGGDSQEQGREACKDTFFQDYIQITISCTEIDDFEYGVDGPDDSYDRWS